MTEHLEKPNPNEWAHTTRSSKGRCLHPFDEMEMRNCPKFFGIRRRFQMPEYLPGRLHNLFGGGKRCLKP